MDSVNNRRVRIVIEPGAIKNHRELQLAGRDQASREFDELKDFE